ncbi:7TMR-DISMED2 domain-containing protein [Magnetovirga frankeli]|uniref:7TMR-DISMED2 domain-containing protein n=1 Tax=Magnetovirga frankeli TaxID=947516 RepID=UPI003D329649
MLSLAGHLAFLDDAEGELDLAAVLGGAAEGFRPLPGFINRGYTGAVSWLRLRVAFDANSPDKLTLWMDPPYLDRVDVWVQRGGRSRRPGQLCAQATGRLGADHRCAEPASASAAAHGTERTR